MSDEIEEYYRKVEAIVAEDPAYKTAAYFFVMEGLEYVLKRIGERRHVTGQELSFGLRDYALEQFGPLAQTVLKHWGILATSDFGAIVYHLIDGELMKKNDQDSIEDFRDVFVFDEGFKNYDFLKHMNE